VNEADSTAQQPRETSLRFQVLIVAGSNIFRVLALMVTGMALSRIFTKDQMGHYQALWLIYLFVTTLLLNGFCGAPLYFVRNLEAAQRGRFHFWLNSVMLLFGVLLGGALFFFPGVFAWIFGFPDLAEPVRYFGIHTFLMVSVLHFTQVEIAEQRPLSNAAFTVFYGASQMLGSIIPAQMGLGVKGVSIWLCWAVLPLWMWASWRLWRITSYAKHSEDRTILRSMMKYSINLSLAAAVQYLMTNVTFWAVGLRYSAAKLAEFRFGGTELPVTPIFARSLIAVVLPRLAELRMAGSEAEMMELWHKSLRRLWFAVFPTFMLTELLAVEIVTTLFSSKYTESAQYLYIFAFLLPTRALVYTELLLALGESRSVMRIWTSGAVLFAITLTALLLWYGPAGAAVANVAVTYVIHIWLQAQCARGLGIAFWQVLPLREMGVLTLAGLLCAPLAILGTQLTSDCYPIVRLLTGGGLYCLGYGILSLVFKLHKR
jgi:O-antigen/teichoic acid export membrane protein